MKKLISIVTPLYNEEGNVDELYQRIKKTMEGLNYDYEHICIDNCSDDKTVPKLKLLAEQDKRLKIIVNARNFGYIRSSFHGLLQSKGDAVVLIASDLQDPPEMIPEFIEKWEMGYKSVMAIKPESDESPIMFRVRKAYYHLIGKISEVNLVKNATGSGLYDKEIIKHLEDLEDPYPYFRGLICELGYPIAKIPFKQPRRLSGVTKNNFYNLYDFAMLGITSHSKVPLRMMTMAGFLFSFLSLLVGIFYLLYKITNWDSFEVGIAPALIGMFFFSAIQMFFLGMLGEYIGSIHTHIRKTPHVYESERINF